MKVLLINPACENYPFDANKGAEALMISTVELLRQFIPDVKITSFVQCTKDLSDKLQLRLTENRVSRVKSLTPCKSVISWLNLLRCFMWAKLYKYFKLNIRVLIGNRKLREYTDADIIIHLGADLYSDNSGGRAVMEHSKDIMCALLLSKPVVIWAESIGPFRTRLTKPVARFVLNRVSLITVREEISKNYLEEIGINKSPVYLTADPAFLLKPASAERIKKIFSEEGIDENAKPLIAICPSQSVLLGEVKKGETRGDKYIKAVYSLGFFLLDLLPERLVLTMLRKAKRSGLYSIVESRYARYKASIAEVADYLVDKYNATVLIMPHDLGESWLFGQPTERIMAKEICQLVRHTDKVKAVTQDYSSEEIKGIIGQCDLFIGSKMHANIAALSQSIPTIGLSYSYKFHGIMGMLGQGQYVCESFGTEEIIKKVENAWARREAIKNELESKSKAVKELALLNGELVKKLVAPEEY